MKTFQTIRQNRRERREARRIFEATKHLGPHTLRDIGLVNLGDLAAKSCRSCFSEP